MSKHILQPVLLLSACLFFAGAAVAQAPVYKWVADPAGASDQVLQETQASRVISLPEAAALKSIRQVMTDDLFLALATYHATAHRQEAETVGETVLPENVAGKVEVGLADETYRFILEVSLKAYGNRTRVRVRATPIYRVRDAEQETQTSTAGESTVEMKIKAPAGAAVNVGRIYVEPLAGTPQDYQLEPLPDAADRAQKLVRSFLYLLDQRLTGQAPVK